MLDISLLRTHVNEVEKKLLSRNVAKGALTAVITLDGELRKIQKRIEEIRAEKNDFSKKVPTLKSDVRSKMLKKMSDLSQEEKILSAKHTQIEKDLQAALGALPNIPADSVPVGTTDKDNTVLRTVGTPPVFDFSPVDYMTLAERHDMIDTHRASKVSGSRFGYLKGSGAQLWFALVQYTVAKINAEGFTLFFPPVLVKDEIMANSGYDSYTDGGEAYYLPSDKLFLVGTGEHALLPYHSDEILESATLPRKYAAYSSCFRREAGSYGKDTKGILRVHQFEKVELVVLADPEKSWEEFDRLVAFQEQLVSSLGLTYHLLEVCTGDLPKPSAKVIDLECWIPSENKYRETHSASNCTDYQARRNQIRMRGADGHNRFTHVLNATAMTPRTMVAIMEQHQRKDGTITIPEPLRPYLANAEVLPNVSAT